MSITVRPGVAFAIGSAVLFAFSTPLAKPLLLQGANPQLLAGLFYLGSGAGLAILQLSRHFRGRVAYEAPLRKSELPRFAAAALLGGVIAPVLLLLGLARTQASTASLLMNLEGIATMTIAWVVFRESTDRRLIVAAIAIVAGAAVLSWSGGGAATASGSLAIAGACVAWGIDNNLTRTLSGADPMQIAMLKGLAAGSTNLALALGTGAHLPSAPLTMYALTLGFFLLRRQPGIVRARPASPGHRTHRGVFFNRAVHRRAARRGAAIGSSDRKAGGGRLTDGRWGLLASAGITCAYPCARASGA